MASYSFKVANLLEKMSSSDQDFRFMATNDLMNELQKDNLKLDDESERKIVRMFIRLLEDKNAEVQNLAVRCLGPLVTKVKENQVETIVDTLCANMVANDEQLRDISSIGMKIVINELPFGNHSLITNISRRIIGRLSNAIEKPNDVSVQLDALDILGDLLLRAGTLLVNYHTQILTSLLPQLCSFRQAIRKRTIVALGYFSMACNATLYEKQICYLTNGLEPCDEQSFSGHSDIAPSIASILSVQCTYIQCLATICRQSGHRFNEYIPRVVPYIFKFSYENEEEIRENCLQALEAFILRCPKEMTPHIIPVIDLCLQFITYDPNYNYEMDVDEENKMDVEEEMSDLDDESNDYSDDDDISWKVRRSATKCLASIISTRKELISYYYKCVSPILITRFKEREENVKSDIFRTFITLLHETRNSYSTMVISSDDESPISMLQNQIPDIIQAISKLKRTKSLKTRHDCFLLLKEILLVVPNSLSSYIDSLISSIEFALGKKNMNSNLKIDALNFIYCLFSSHSPGVLHPYIDSLLPFVINAVEDDFYKVVAEGLHVLQEMVLVMRPLNGVTHFHFELYVSRVYDCTLKRLCGQEIDQEVKEGAISCISQILSNFGDHLHAEMLHSLPILLDRLRNEITRLITVKAFINIASSPLNIDLSVILCEMVVILSGYLRKNHRPLKIATLTLLDILIHRYHESISTEHLDCINLEIPTLINESDLHVTQLTLMLLTSIIERQPHSLENTCGTVLAPIITLVKSPLLQGTALQSSIKFFQVLVRVNFPSFQYNDLILLLVNQIIPQQVNQVPLHKQSFYSLAKCVAAVAVTNTFEVKRIVDGFITDIEITTEESKKVFLLLALGEVGRNFDMNTIPKAKQVVVNALGANSEEIKLAASNALGYMTLGNPGQFIPLILKEIETHPKRQYLLFQSLKEVISSMSAIPERLVTLGEFIPLIWSALFKYCECEEEGTRNVVAECLGKLTLIKPYELLPRLETALESPSALTRMSVVVAIKFTISDRPQEIDTLLRHSIEHFLNALRDLDLNVRRVALVTFNSAAHNKPILVCDLLDVLLPQLYEETKIKKELIHEVEMGPFKHIVDDGLDIRKAAFECMYTILNAFLDRLDLYEFLNHIVEGLRDHYDIKMLTYLITIRLASLCPQVVLQRLDRLVEPLRATCTLKLKTNSVKQEFEKHDDLKKSAMRAIVALYNIPDASKNLHLAEFIAHINATASLQPIFETILRESQQGQMKNHDNMLLE